MFVSLRSMQYRRELISKMGIATGGCGRPAIISFVQHVSPIVALWTGGVTLWMRLAITPI